MKCYSVTESGVAEGIRFSPAPYPHVLVGDAREEYDYRRVKIDPQLASQSRDTTLTECSVVLDTNNDDRRRASYTLAPPSGADADKALVKIEVRAGAGVRTWYEFPRYTFSVAKGWVAEQPGAPRVLAPVELVVLEKGAAIRVMQTARDSGKSNALMTLAFDGVVLRRA